MNRALLLLAALGAGLGFAEDPSGKARTIGLREAMRIAMDSAADVRIGRVAAQRARTDVASLRAERLPRLRAGSGLGATSGIPQSVQGATPSVAQLTLSQPLLDLQRPRAERSVREAVRESEHRQTAAEERSAYVAGTRYLDFELAALEAERLLAELSHHERLERLAEARVEEGVDVPLTLARARLDTARARERHANAQSRARLLAAELSVALGMDPVTRIAPAGLDSGSASRLEAAARAQPRDWDDHPELAALSASLRSARNRVGHAKAARLPKLDLVAQYAVLARFNNYDDYFRRFQRHNVQAGVAVTLPLFPGREVGPAVARARLHERDLALRRDAMRASLALEMEKADATLQGAERREHLAAQELAYARARLDMLLAHLDEGRAGLGQVLRARIAESSAWGARMGARFDLARARLAAAYSAGRILDVLAD